MPTPRDRVARAAAQAAVAASKNTGRPVDPRVKALAASEHQLVVLTRDLPAEGLSAGAIGTVVGSYDNDGYEVEFTADDGHTIAVATLGANDIQLHC
ncbi:DUF4926 domain-containing protein [Mycolicibacter sp. MYC123]|uniref:DUF4926 domain-containing protein n=1 Tax=[Mycobacterium] zoologicum TaxID=2872311 RepID=A0ABU5YPY6_9MYCO|nr:DUF4926 domain-containing protein [Mycolicibacter sp. MYC123]MEB3052130.1 DUF4926 domain-containing protein [Mycolicibacter sp. MYC123]